MYISMEFPHHVGEEGGRLSALPVGDSIESKRKAYAAIAVRYQAELLQTARRLCQGNEDRAQDQVQDALIRGYEAFLNGKFMAGSNARAWLIRILTNSFINAYRRSKRWDAAIDVDTLTSGGEAGPASTHVPASEIPGQAMIEDTLDDNLEKALNGLSNGLRVCVILVDIEGLDYAEAAAALDIPVGTVRSRLSRARIQLHEALREFALDRRLI